MKFRVTTLGTNGAVPAYGRFPTSQIVNVQEHLYMIDCGEGAQMRIAEYGIKWSKIKQLFISHMHGDHIYGIIGLLSSMSLNDRKVPLHLHGPPELEAFIQGQLSFTGPLSFSLSFSVVNPQKYECIYEDEVVEVYSLPLIHRIPTSGFLFSEKLRPRSMIGSMIETYNIPYAAIPGIKQGADYPLPDGTLLPNRVLTTDPPPVRKYAYCSDTAYNESLIPLLKDVDLLYHEATFTDDLRDKAKATMHSTALQAAQIALRSNVKHLMLGHFSSRYKDTEVIGLEARSIFPNTSLAYDGKETSL